MRSTYSFSSRPGPVFMPLRRAITRLPGLLRGGIARSTAVAQARKQLREQKRLLLVRPATGEPKFSHSNLRMNISRKLVPFPAIQLTACGFLADAEQWFAIAPVAGGVAATHTAAEPSRFMIFGVGAERPRISELFVTSAGQPFAPLLHEEGNA